MKKIYVLFTFLSFSQIIFGQTDWTKYEAIVNVQSKDPQELSSLITKPYDSPREKSEAIYYWVTHNIKYDLRELKKLKKKDNSKPMRLTSEEVQLRYQKMISETIKQKKGVCQDYAILFKELCNNAGIECEKVGGWMKNNAQKTSDLGERHAWNVIKIDNEWEVVDPTSGSGYRNRKGKFEFAFNPHYFFMDKEIFKMSRFPREEEWQLTENKVDKKVFKKFPFLGNGFMELNGKNISQKESKIYIKRGTSVDITFESDAPISKLVVANHKKGKVFPYEVQREGTVNSITLNTKDFRNGLYFFYDDKKLLFIYRISIK